MTLNPLMSRQRVEIPDRPTPTKAQKAAAWNAVNGLCELCGKPVAPSGPDVQYDHRDMREITGDDSVSNLRPLHVACHARKTSDHDAPLIAKVRRQEKLTKARVKPARGFRQWRRFDGTIVRRPQS